MVIKEILITVQSGVRGLSEEKVKYYNLDAILSLGYRVNSVQATAFRKWATSVLKQYMLKGYVVNHNAVSEQKDEDLKRALGLLENVFSQNFIMAEQQAKELFAVVKDYTYALDTLDAETHKKMLLVPWTRTHLRIDGYSVISCWVIVLEGEIIQVFLNTYR